MRPARLLLPLLLGACPEPEGEVLQVGYRDGGDGGGQNGERGNVDISEILWSGSVRETPEGPVYDTSDVFIELRNEGSRPLNLSGWRLQVRGAMRATYVLPDSDFVLGVAQHAFVAAKADGCFLEPEWVIPELELPLGDPFTVTLRDIDERLIETAGSEDMPPFAGGYDLVMSRSMELATLLFGGNGRTPHLWHHYTDAPVDVPNDTRVHEDCRRLTGASPGLPNSPDYSGAFGAGAFE